MNAISQAKTEILVQAYSFTSAPIAKALVDAHKRGVHVEIILDRSQRKERYSSADFTAHAGIPTYIDAAHAIAHNKVMIIDKSMVITGSFNFTRQQRRRTPRTFSCSDRRSLQGATSKTGRGTRSIRRDTRGGDEDIMF